MSYDIEKYSPRTGRIIKEDGTTINEADILEGMLETIDTLICKIAITGTISAMTTLTTNASGVNFTKSGDSVYLGATATEYNDNTKLKMYKDGVLKEKGIDLIYVSTYGFYSPVALNNGDVIMVIKGI
jgi:hypothetical protein